MLTKVNVRAKPFLKWAGGKTQLLNELELRLPQKIKEDKKIKNYIEPFVGAGALFFYLAHEYELENSTIIDNNIELVIAYKTIKKTPFQVIKNLEILENKFLSLSMEERSDMFYQVRNMYNEQLETIDVENYSMEWDKRTAWMIFLNRTCFNGLFRLNRKGEFNVPFGKYKNPRICDSDNLVSVHEVLQGVNILYGDFEQSLNYIVDDTILYFDPPYRPLSSSSSFTSYTKEGFNDECQIRLANFCDKLDGTGKCKFILSNSDPKNTDKKDDFFDDLYSRFSIERVYASRMINSSAKGRGRITEIIVSNI